MCHYCLTLIAPPTGAQFCRKVLFSWSCFPMNSGIFTHVAAFTGPRFLIPSSDQGREQEFNLCFIHCSISDFFLFFSFFFSRHSNCLFCPSWSH